MSHVSNAEESCLKSLRSSTPNTKLDLTVQNQTRNEIVATDLSHHALSPCTTIATYAPSVTHDEKLQFPEGGLHSWLVVLGCWCAQFLVFGIVNSTAAFQDYLSSNQLHDHSTGEIAWIFSIQLFLVFFLGLYVGPIFDAHGPRVLVAIGSVGSVLSMILLGFCSQYWHFMLCYGVLGGASNALLSVPSYAAIGHFFDRRRGFATGISCTAGSIGGVVVPLMLRSLLPKIGFAWSVRILGFMLLALAVPANLFIKKRLPANRKRPTLIPDLSALKDAKFAFCVGGMFLMEWGLFVPIAYISSYVSEKFNDESLGFTVLALLNAGSFFGRFIPGYLADRFGRFNVIIVTIALCAVTELAIWLPAGSSEAAVIVFAVLFGFVSGSNLGLIPVCLSQLCEVEDYGRAFSAAYFVISFGTLTSIPIGGQILEIAGGYWGIITFAGLSYAAALICYIISRVLAVGWNPKTFF